MKLIIVSGQEGADVESLNGISRKFDAFTTPESFI